MSTTTSPLLDRPGAVAGDGIDAPVAAHYGSLYGEQKALAAGEGFVDLSHREVFRVTGPDRLTWLHSLTTQYVDNLEPGRPVNVLILSPNGHIEHAFTGVDDGEAFTAHTEPGRAEALTGFLERMKFMTRVEVEIVDDLAVAWRPTPAEERAGKFDLVPRAEFTTYAQAAGPAAGLWAYDALRIERGEPRYFVDTDERTIPNEIGVLGLAEGASPWEAVHLDKGCYRGQETVARVNNLDRPPRRLTLLHLDGSENRLPAPGSPITAQGKERPIGVIGSSARHHELGPIALALLKRNTPTDAPLEVDGMPAAQEVVVDPEIGQHFRPRR